MIKVEKNFKTGLVEFKDLKVGDLFLESATVKMKVAVMESGGEVTYHGVAVETGHSGPGNCFDGLYKKIDKAVLTVE